MLFSYWAYWYRNQDVFFDRLPNNKLACLLIKMKIMKMMAVMMLVMTVMIVMMVINWRSPHIKVELLLVEGDPQ